MIRDSDNGAHLEDRFPRQTWIVSRKWDCAIRAFIPRLFAHRLAPRSSPDATITPPGPELLLKSATLTPDIADKFQRVPQCSPRSCGRMVTALRLSARITTSRIGRQVSPDHSTGGR